MPSKNVHAVALIRGIYKVSAATNPLVRKSDPFRGRLLDRDWVICVNKEQGAYMVLVVEGARLTGLKAYRFHASPVGRPLRWVPSEDDMLKLMLGQTIIAPMDLESFATAEALTTLPIRIRAALADGNGQDD